MRVAVYALATMAAFGADLEVRKVSAPITFAGMCDASAAIFDSGTVLVLNDEDQDQPLLRFFDVARGGGPARVVKLSTAGLDVIAKKPEIDFESTALIGSKLFIAGSHSRSKNGKVRLSRQQVFAVDWPVRGGSVRISGTVYTGLLPDLQAVLRTDSRPSLKKLLLDADMPPKEGGVNVEGMAATPAGELLFGLRSPLVDGQAIAVTLKNPARVVAGERAKLGDVVLLNLDGGGVRDVIWHPGLKLYLVIGGPATVSGKFGLYRWTGQREDKPVLVQRLGKKQLGLPEELKAEALAVAPDGRSVWVFFDEGDRMTGGVECKESGSKNFRGVMLSF